MNKLLESEFWKTATVEDVTKILGGSADVETRDKDGRTPLHWAAAWNRSSKLSELFALLLDAGANLEARDIFGWTPLHWSLTSGVYDGDIESYKEGVALLLERGADIEIRDNKGATPLHVAVRGPRYGPRHSAKDEGGIPEVVALLIDRGANLEARDNDGSTPLHVAVRRPRYWARDEGGIPKVVTLLIDRGANLEARDNSGSTPLHCATRSCKIPELVELLLEKGANTKVQDEEGKTPFAYAKQNEYLQNTKAYWLLNEKQTQKRKVMRTSLKYDGENDTPITLYLPDGQTWGEIYDIQLVVVIAEKSNDKTFNIGIHIPVAAIWEANGKVSVPDNSFEILMSQPYPEMKYKLAVFIDDKEIRLNLRPIDNEEKGAGKLNHKFSNVLAMKFKLV